MKLTDHFALEEFTLSQTATRMGLDNEPGPDALANLSRLAQLLEQVRTLLGNKPILISSGFRSRSVNRAVGGVDNSAHAHGCAADFTCPGFGTPLEVCRKIDASTLAWDQLIFERTWVHLAVAMPGVIPRQQVLTAHFQNAGPTRYTKGLG